MKLDMDIKNETTGLNSNPPVSSNKKPITRFIITSGLFHLITASAIVITNHIPQNDVDKELVEVDFSVPAGENSAPEIAPIPEQMATSAAVEPQSAPTAPVVEQKLAEPAPEAPVITKAPEPIKQPPVSKPIPVLVEKKAVTPVAKTNDEAKVKQQEMDRLDQENDEKLKAAAAKFQEDTARAENEMEESTQKVNEQIKKENEEAAAQIAARAEALRQEEEAKAAAVAKAQAADAAAKAEKENADRIASEKMAAEKSKEGSGQKDAGPGEIATEVRALEQLKQMPGNPKPLYESAERLKGDKGIVVFQAFVTQDGRLTDFKLLQSTGFKNLDSKTLKALKQWKFYPGQEGWVELPFDWNLKGGPQEMPALLRRKASRGN